VQRIDLERGVVTTSAAERSYDQLVIALGSVTTVPEKIPGAREHALVFRSPADAMQLRNRIIDALEGAHQATDEAARRAWLTFVVIGGGDTGTELAATIYDFAQHAVEKEYPWLVDEAIRVVVIESADRLVPLSSKAASERVRASLERRGITVHTGVGVDRIDEQAVYAGDLSVPTGTAYWAAGVAPPELVREIDADHAKNGALLVDEHLRVRGRSNVYAIGDNAWAVDYVDGQAVPALAQAVRSKRLVRVRRDHVVERVDDQPKTHRGANNDDGGDDDEGNGCIHGGSFGNRHGGGVPVRTRKRIFGTLR
jgi:NADH dehydrogenase